MTFSLICFLPAVLSAFEVLHQHPRQGLLDDDYAFSREALPYLAAHRPLLGEEHLHGGHERSASCVLFHAPLFLLQRRGCLDRRWLRGSASAHAVLRVTHGSARRQPSSRTCVHRTSTLEGLSPSCLWRSRYGNVEHCRPTLPAPRSLHRGRGASGSGPADGR